MDLSPKLLELDHEQECLRISAFIRSSVGNIFKKKGVVVAVSGGIDSSTTAALCVRALGPSRVLALLMPERDSSSDSVRFGRMLVDHLGIASETIDIAPILEAMGCYRYRDEAIRGVFPEYGPGYKNKIVLNEGSSGNPPLHFFSVVIQSPDGVQRSCRLPLKNYLQIVAATNMKQRTRKSLEYFHADRLNLAVAGTPNFLEYDQGFFVKLGDGAADLKPIAHLYKTQVYSMARFLGLPSELCQRKPTTDTYSLDQTQEEFFFGLPLDKLDLILFGVLNGFTTEAISAAVGISLERIESYIEGMKQKRASTAGLHMNPLNLVKPLELGTH